MAVYVDSLFDTRGWSAQWPYPTACHLTADTDAELHVFARGLGLRRAWFQAHSIHHYDLTARRRRMAVGMGAIEEEGHEAYERRKSARGDHAIP